MKKVIVTGANGFVGSALCKQLSENGVTITAVVRRGSANVEKIQNLDNISIVYSDLSEFRNLSTMISERGYDICYHLAWGGSAGPARGDETIQIQNVQYACDTVRACAELGCKKFVFASSIMEYEIEKLMNTEAVPGISTLYSTAKVAADYMCRSIAASLGIDYLRAIISNIYGPGEVSPRLVNSTIRKLLAGDHCAFSPGEQLYDFIFIDDAARIFEAIGEKGVSNRTYYIGSQYPRPLKEFLLEIKEQVSPNAMLGIGEIPFQGITLTYDEFDIGAVAKDTGVFPEVTFAEGIRRTAAWIKENG